MKGDLSRQTFDPERHYSSVRMQQGRVQLDADWNEQADIGLHRTEAEAADVIGPCGAPLADPAFGIALDLTGLSAEEKARLDALFPPSFKLAAGDFLLGAGHYYVDGILCESEHVFPYTAQPDLPGVDPLDVAQAGFHVVYLDVWQRHLTALDDPHLRETALGGPDTATRSRTVWQVRTVFAGAGPVTCATDVPAYDEATAPSTGLLSARAQPAATDTGPCLVPSDAGFRGLENQLYRVEIHGPGEPYDVGAGVGDAAITSFPAPRQVVYAGGTWNVGDAVEVFSAKAGADPMAGQLAFVTATDTGSKTLTLNAELPALSLDDLPRIRPARATYKWSRDNGSVVSLVETVSGADLVVHSLGPDDVLGFAAGQWVEISDDERELNGEPGELAQIENVTPATNTITLRAVPSFPGDVPTEDPSRHLKIRRWDGAGAVKIKAPAPSESFAALEDGVEVRFEAGTYDNGDYWLVPARTATADAQSGTIEWPTAGGKPAALRPLGIEHHYCRIGLIESNGTTLTAHDCRPIFPALTDPTLVYVGGDGQEAMPGEPLPHLLEVGVFRGPVPVAGARVAFATAASGKLAATIAAVGGGTTTITATTTADGIARCAWLLDPDRTKPSQEATATLLDASDAPLAPHVDFGGELSIAEQVAYFPDDACADLQDAHTVQEAIDTLCKRPTGGCAIVVTPDERIDEVVKALLEQGKTALCLCLTAGEHKLSDGLELDGAATGLELEGCGAGTQLVVEGGGIKLVGLDAVVLRDLDVVLESDALIAIENCIEVAIESCSVHRTVGGPVLCTIGGAERIRLVDDVFDAHQPSEGQPVASLADLLQLPDRRRFAREAGVLAAKLAGSGPQRKNLQGEIGAAGDKIAKLSRAEQDAYTALGQLLGGGANTVAAFLGAFLVVYDAAANASAPAALVLEDGGAETEVAECRLVGALGLYGVPGDDVLDDGDLKRLKAGLASGLIELDLAAGALHLRDNALGRVAVSADVIAALKQAPNKVTVSGLFADCLLSDNVLTVPQSSLVTGHAALTSNDFRQRGDDAGSVFGNSATFVSNHAPDDIRLFSGAVQSAVAANLTLNVVIL